MPVFRRANDAFPDTVTSVKRLKPDSGDASAEVKTSEQIGQRVHRFLTPRAASDQAQANTIKPAFVHLASAVDGGHDPLPEVFSPHRRGYRFVPGGMAAEASTWVSELGYSVQRSRHARGMEGMASDSNHVLEVQSVAGTDVQYMTGTTRQRSSKAVMLVESKDVQTGHLNKVFVGDLVDIREPTWSVDLGRGAIVVATDWHVLK